MIKMSFNLPEDMREDLQLIAKAWDRDMTWVVRKFIQEGIDKNLLPEEDTEKE